MRTPGHSILLGVTVFTSMSVSLLAVPAKWKPLLSAHCFDCHDAASEKGGIDLESALEQPLGERTEIWEKAVRQLQTRLMPPVDKDRPSEAEYSQLVESLEKALDVHASRHPNPGRSESVRRLTRNEYQRVIRDLLALEIDATSLLPPDQASHGFDNVTVGDLSPALLDRYISAAQKISRLALGRVGSSPDGRTVRLRPDFTQEGHVKGLPFGTRGGTLIRHTFPRSGDYIIRLNLMRDRDEKVEGINGVHELQVLLDGEVAASFEVRPPKNRSDHTKVDAHLLARIRVQAGSRELGVTFVKTPSDLIETLRQPYEAAFNTHRHPRRSPAVYQVTITGPFDATGPGDTPSRRRVFPCRPTDASQAAEAGCAQEILATLARRAYRRPVTDADVALLLGFYREGREVGDFDAGIEMALRRLLVSPEFLFRVERDPEDDSRGPYDISDLALASRLSFFLWASIPDDELLDVAANGTLRDPGVLEAQVRRMLADPRADTLVTNFAAQWLYLRNLPAVSPNFITFPDFDDTLRRAMRQETELFFGSIIHEDRSALDLLTADYTFVNERLAKHYDIPNIYGSHFRRITLPPESPRGGLLGQASILAVTAYATRTSPVVRGKWILENLLGTPPPPPPPNVPPLSEDKSDAVLSMRERMVEHRRNPVCASCHAIMDPVGLSLENFDAVGRWRTLTDGFAPIDASGSFPDGTTFDGVSGLKQAILGRSDQFIRTLTEKLLTYALGRAMEYYDAPAVRAIERTAARDDYRFSSLILGIVKSTPFQMRRPPGPPTTVAAR